MRPTVVEAQHPSQLLSANRLIELLSTAGLFAVLELALDSIPEQLFIAATRGEILMMNNSAQRVHDLQPEVVRSVVARAVLRGSNDRFSVRRLHLPHGAAIVWVASAAAAPRDHASLAAIASLRWGLTTRQRSVLTLLLEGISNRQIAGRLERAENTIELHVTAVLRKSGAKTRAQAIARTFELAQHR